MSNSTPKLILSFLVVLWSTMSAGYAQRPVQLSFIPGWSTNGPLNAQEKNNFSINLIGGSAAGLDGVELGGVFNIDTRKVKGAQLAGVLNIVGDSVKGAQLAGVANTAKRVKGAQLAGVYNQADNVQGIQAAGVLNKTHHLKGIQLGVINIADTSDGVSIGLINIIHHGMHELSVYADEWSPLNVAFRSGNPKFYGILFVGLNPDHNRRSYYYGYGLGHAFTFTPHLSLRPELSVMQVSPVDWGNFDKGTFLTRFNLDIHWRPTKNFGVSAGPSFTFYNPQKNFYIGTHLYEPLPHGYSTFHFTHSNATGWIGWRVAVNLF